MKSQEIRVLLVDDDADMRAFLADFLRLRGFDVELAEDGRDALAMCAANRYDIVFTDLNMPHIDGLTLIKRLRARWPMIEAVVITGYATVDSSIDALRSGAADVICKPIVMEQLQLAVQRSCQRIRERVENRELQLVARRLREVNELKDKFLSIANHELRTPLTVIKGYLEILDMISTDGDREVGEIVKIVSRATAELCGTVDRLNILSRLNRTNLRPESTRCNLSSALITIGQESERLFARRNIHLHIQIQESPLHIAGPPVIGRIILRELLQNSLKFTPDGGRVSVLLKRHGESVRLIVQDTGIGIPAEKQELIFADFYEVEDSIHHKSSALDFKGGGVGIGLSIIRDIVDSLNGTILLNSQPGKGTVFSLLLPLARSGDASLAEEGREISRSYTRNLQSDLASPQTR